MLVVERLMLLLDGCGLSLKALALGLTRLVLLLESEIFFPELLDGSDKVSHRHGHDGSDVVVLRARHGGGVRLS